MNIRLTLLTIGVLTFHIAIAQKRTTKADYKLLWKIEGKSLSKPSYLFGTMHLYDDRVFDFSDSVLLKLNESSAFAIEVHPDSVVSIVFKMLLNGSKENKFKEMLSPREYEEIDSLVQLRSGYTLEKLRSPLLARMMIEKKIGKKDKSLFLDAYLYSLARNSGKKILGLENAKDQLETLAPRTSKAIRESLLQQTDNSNNKYSEQLISIYQQGNLDEIDAFLKKSMQSDPTYYKRLLTDRNLIMVESIEKYIQQANTFIAVGAGHLPGEEGIIRLLQKKGYKVTPVKSAFTGMAKKFKAEKAEYDWETYKIDKAGYSVQTPTSLITFRIDSLNLTLRTSVDISGPSFYQTTYMMMDEELKGKESAVAIEKFEARLRSRQKGTIENIKRVQVAGMEALEFTQNTKGIYFRNLFVLREPVIYLLQAGPTKDAAFSKDTDRFFSSLRVEDFQGEQWKEFKDEEGAFAIQLYGEPKVKNNSVNYESFPILIHAYYTEDMNQRETFLVRYNDLPPGYTSQNDSVYYTAFANDLKDRMKGTNIRFSAANISGFSGLEFSFETGANSLAKGRVVLRGNRFYLLLASTTRNNSPRSGINNFFSSFHFTKYKELKLSEYSLNDNMRIHLPAPFRYDSVLSTEKQKIYYSVDPYSGIQFMVRTDEFAPYEYVESEKDFFESHYKLEKTDSIYSRTRLQGKNYFGEEVLIKSTKTNFQTKTQTFIHGKEVIEVNAFLPEDADLTNVAIDYFKSVKIPESIPTWNLLSPKTSTLLADLASTDSLVNQQAKDEISSYALPVSDLPLLYKAIQKNYPDDLNENTSIKRSLLIKLAAVNDSTTVNFISNVYPQLPHTAEVHGAALHALSSIHTVEAANTLLNLVKNEDLKLNGYYSLSGFADSVELVGPILPELFKHQSSFDFKWYMVSLITSWLEKVEESDLRQTIIQLLITEANKELVTPQLVDLKHEDYYYHSRLYKELARGLTYVTPTDEIKQIQRKITNTGYYEAMLVTLPYLIKQRVKINVKDLEKVAAKPLYRLSLYNTLKEINHDQLFPALYRTQEKFAESMLIQYMNSEDVVPELHELIGQQNVDFKERKQKIFVYKHKNSDDNEWYLAVSGPFYDKEFTSDESLTYQTYIPYSPATLLNDLEKVLDNTGAKVVK
jgi:uncharacterized protein YbaP (TraB family)